MEYKLNAGLTAALLSLLLSVAAPHAGAAEDEGHNALALLVSVSMQVVDQPCKLRPGDEQIAMDFGNIINKTLGLHGRTASKPFSIHLEQCDPKIKKSVSIVFNGAEDKELAGLLALQPGSEASGIAIGLETSTGVPIAINKSSNWATLVSGTNELKLGAYVAAAPAHLKQDRALTLGAFTAAANFTLLYQ
jgi:type 1 fimbria pilin